MSGTPRGGYGSLGRIGVGTPQANPTVEAEMAILLPRACTLHVARLTSCAESADSRLRAYLLGLHEYLATYDTFRPDVFGFACTGSSYLLGAHEEQRLLATAKARFNYPIETAARSIVWSLERMQARRIALVAAYPAALLEAGARYWTDAGFDVVRTHRIATRTVDTRAIYALTSDDLAAALGSLPQHDIDAVLVSGTGLPSLLPLRARRAAVPAISSNMCLAARLLALLGHSAWLEARLPVIRGWEHRLDEAFSSEP
jgi:maleate isomerase